MVVVTAKEDSKVGKSWSPEYEAVKSQIHASLLQEPSIQTLHCIVDQERWLGGTDHPYKAHKQIQCKSIPTAILFRGGREFLRTDNVEDFKDTKFLGALTAQA